MSNKLYYIASVSSNPCNLAGDGHTPTLCSTVIVIIIIIIAIVIIAIIINAIVIIIRQEILRYKYIFNCLG